MFQGPVPRPVAGTCGHPRLASPCAPGRSPRCSSRATWPCTWSAPGTSTCPALRASSCGRTGGRCLLPATAPEVCAELFAGTRRATMSTNTILHVFVWHAGGQQPVSCTRRGCWHPGRHRTRQLQQMRQGHLAASSCSVVAGMQVEGLVCLTLFSIRKGIGCDLGFPSRQSHFGMVIVNCKDDL